MKFFKVALFAFIVVGSGCKSRASDCSALVAQFLNKPSSESREGLERADSGACSKQATDIDENFHRLVMTVSSGSDAAAEFLAAQVASIDGGQLEDALIAIGSYSERNLQGLLRLAQLKKISEKHLSESLVATPLSLADKFADQVAVLSGRRELVSKLSDPSLSYLKTQLLQTLDAAIAETKRAAESLSRSPTR